MIFTAEIKIMPLKELLDPQGKAVMGGLDKLGISGVSDVRIGKHVQMTLEASTSEEAKKIAEEAANKLLANAVMEQFVIEIN